MKGISFRGNGVAKKDWMQYQGCTQYHDWWESRVSYDDTLCPHDTSLTPNRDATGNLIF